MASRTLLAAFAVVVLGGSLLAAPAQPPAAAAKPSVDYVVGPQDVLTITSYDQADLSGRFSVEADGTFTYPMIGRFTAGGLTLRQVEDGLKKRLKDEGFFRNPQITVAVEQYKSQRVFIVGEVRLPGTYPLSGNMNLVEAISRAGSTLPTASGDVIIVHAGENASEPTVPDGDPGEPGDNAAKEIVRVNLRDLESGAFSRNAQLRDGDTIFV